MRERRAALETVLRFRRLGLTLRQAAGFAEVHVATVCRWQKADPAFRQALAEAAAEARARSGDLPSERERVPWHRDCPLCRARVVVRTARGGGRFWRCGCWPHCGWASWRPRAPRNCRRCGGPLYWAHSRKSVSCSGCGVRTRRP
jgi:hypothetical protein